MSLSIKRFIGFICLLLTLTAALSVAVFASGEPVISVKGYAVSITEADGIKDIRFAPGEYSTPSAIKAAEGNVALSNSLVKKNTADGIFSYNMSEIGSYTFWVRMTDGREYFLYADVLYVEPYVTSYGVKITVHDLSDVKDLWIAKGEYNSYRELKNAGYITSATGAKVTSAHTYSYTVYEPGVHTVIVRQNDGTVHVLHTTLTVDEPVFTTNGLRVTVSNIPDVKVIRTAYGEWNTVKELKATDTIRNFSNKTAIKNADPYNIQYREEGKVTVIVEYNNGYIKVFHYDVKKNVPTVVQNDDTVVFGNLDNLQHIRYAPGVYSTSAEIKQAEGMVNLRTDAIVDGTVTVSALEPGVYTFLVQYTDESYNYYIITVESQDATNVAVSSAFTDNMMVQRDKPLSVWGTADASSGRVTVTFGGKTATAEVDALGRWKATFADSFAYDKTPKDITVSGASGGRVIKDVLVGDVYYIMGQSNVFYDIAMLKAELESRGESLNIDYSDDRDIRFFRISALDYADMTGVAAQGTSTVYTDVYTGRPWQKPSDIETDVVAHPENCYSALGYLFAYNMSHKSEVPVGVIEIDSSGSPLIAFAPNELAEKWGTEVYDEESGTYYYSIAGTDLTDFKTRFMYNQAIHPLSGFSTAGIIWYQGESDAFNHREKLGRDSDNYYATQFAELMTYFRQSFGNSDFPVYMIELPPCYSNYGANEFIDYGEVNTEIGTIPNMLSDTYTVSSSDLWFEADYQNNIHPPIKHLQASRLTELVCAVNGIADTDLENVHGPIFRDAVYNGTSVILTFDHVGQGLCVAHPDILGSELKGLEILIVKNGIPGWYELTGEYFSSVNSITIDAGTTVYGVRYHADTELNSPYGVNLCNSYGMPAIAFVNYSGEEVPGTDINLVTPTATNVTVSAAFSDNMILQRDEKLSVWGIADPGGVVVVELGGKACYAEVNESGSWKATFNETFSYTTEGQPLTVKTGQGNIVLNNVLIGDVYFVIGQSNVAYSLGEQLQDLKLKNQLSELAVDYNDSRDIRFFRISSTDYTHMQGVLAQGTTTLYTAVANGEKWLKPSEIATQIINYANIDPENEDYDRVSISSNVFSALGYMFAYNMSNKSDVPCGVIEIDASGYPLMTFAPNELADKWGHDRVGEDGRYYYYLNENVNNPNHYTRFAYNQQIYPLTGFSIAGIIWYQGESDLYNIREWFGADYTNGFANQFTELMTYYRGRFGNSDFPVYLIEFPSCYSESSDNAYMDIGGVRAELGTIPQLLDDCYIVSSSDLWYDAIWNNNIHPPVKHKQAIRLAEIVCANRFGINDIDYVCGPVLADVEYVTDSKAYLTFDHVAGGLDTADGTCYVKGIEIMIIENGEAKWIQHEGLIITGSNQITIDAGSFKLIGVRYNRNTSVNFPNYVNLCNSYKMPAVAFVDYR